MTKRWKNISLGYFKHKNPEDSTLNITITKKIYNFESRNFKIKKLFTDSHQKFESLP